ncbi:hypothetical protein ACJMK2_024972, partial [Sinanodonta woodiana]
FKYLSHQLKLLVIPVLVSKFFRLERHNWIKQKMKFAFIILLLGCMMFQKSYSCGSPIRENKPCFIDCGEESKNCKSICSAIYGSGPRDQSDR